MNAETLLPEDKQAELTKGQALLASSLSGVEEFADSLKPLRKAIRTARNLGDENGRKMALRLQAKLDALEPSITMIGQIKSGKTTLVNCMIGWPDLLPADVNPWTSVVTSLHLSPTPLTPEMTAKFSFFEHNEWERLTAGGGRIGELADRAGADEELSKIKRQVEEMREKSQARLGRKFEALLGQTHDYGYFDQELIERYVCLGDDLDETASAKQGQFADITRSADLTFWQPATPMRLCIRDTPGVNDTFMMREQITIRSIRDSRLCVVVLSAHQALSSTDLALVRLISNVKSRDVIIFVNRIDELSDPGTQVPQIKQSIRDTLAKQGGPEDAEIVLGSALWAQHAMLGKLKALPEASKDALINWANTSEDNGIKELSVEAILWELSGLPALNAAVAARISEGVGRETIAQLVSSTRNLLTGIELRDNLAEKSQIEATKVHISPEEIGTTLAALREQCLAVLNEDLDYVEQDFSARLDRAHANFLGRATEALVQHLERYGENTVWEYDPTGLRMLLSSAYKSYGRYVQAAYVGCVEQISAQVAALYCDALHLPGDLFDIQSPPVPRVPPPVSLGQTIALDLKGSWWKSWWFRRRGYQAFAADFHKMVEEETISVVDDLRVSQCQMYRQIVIDEVDRFLTEQSDVLLDMVQSSHLGVGKIDQLFDRKSLEARDRDLRAAHSYLDQYVE